MILKGVIALILCYFAEFIALQADYLTVEDRPVISEKYRLVTVD